MIRSWDVRKVFLNADVNEVIYAHPGANLCNAGHYWWLRKALCETRMASQMWGETVRAVMDSGGWHCLQSVLNAYFLLADGHHEDDSGLVCHGDDFLAECSERTLKELDRLLSEHFEVNDRAREARTDQIPQENHWLHRRSSGARWFWFLVDGRPQACGLLGAVDEEARW